MNLAAELLTGSSKADQLRKDIATLVNMALGFLDDEDQATLDLANFTLLSEFSNHRWMVRNDPAHGLKFRLFHLEDAHVTRLVCELPNGRIPLDYVGFVHHYLDSFVRGMNKLFPVLHERWSPLLQIGRDELSMYYKLRFYVPSNDSVDGKDGKLNTFKKKIAQSFPLPIDTEVFIHLEGETGDSEEQPVSDEGCYFQVVEYEHQAYDVFGDFTARYFAIVLEPQDGYWDVASSGEFQKLLKANGWVQDDY